MVIKAWILAVFLTAATYALIGVTVSADHRSPGMGGAVGEGHAGWLIR